MNDANYQTFVFNFSRQPTGLTFDPNNDIVLKQATTTLQSPATKTLTLTAFIEGFYDASANIMTPDSATVLLRNVTTPYSVIDSAKAVLNSSGTGTFAFQKIFNNAPYFIQIKHRNSIDVWSRSPGQSFTSSLLTYNFTDTLSKAYGSNMIKVDNSPVKYAIYGGDVDRDGNTDASDISVIDNDALNTLSGYVVSDLTGDDFVDANDISIVDNNSLNSVSVITP